MLILIYVINYNYEKNKKEINKIYIEFEELINEICEMGINPIQLFNKPHIKKERNQKEYCFFHYLLFLMRFEKLERKK